jgi:hypothetical protein
VTRLASAHNSRTVANLPPGHSDSESESETESEYLDSGDCPASAVRWLSDSDPELETRPAGLLQVETSIIIVQHQTTELNSIIVQAIICCYSLLYEILSKRSHSCSKSKP